jgi:hypothetical protein
MGTDPQILAKKNQTNIDKFGNHPMKVDSIKQQLKETFVQNYGVDNPSKSNIVKEKMRNTFIKNYGVDNPSKNKHVIEKIRVDAVARYANNRDEILEKRRATSIESFGVASNKQRHIPNDSIRLMKDIEWLKHQHFELKKPLCKIADELGISPTPLSNFLHSHQVVPARQTITTVHHEIVDFIKQHYAGPIDTNNRTVLAKKEIDIFLPDLGLGIEVDGVFWHSEERGKNKLYHLDKTKQAEEKQIHLMHVYDTEWNNPVKQNIIKSKLLHQLGHSSKIFARKCQIKELTSNQAAVFLENNHIQGTCPSKIKLGLFTDIGLVAVATVGKSRYNKKYSWELLRYCTKNNHTVIGGLGKLLNYLKNQYQVDSIVSYADRRWSMNSPSNIYETLGFKLLQISPPNYKYFKINATEIKLLSRTQFQKHLLKDKLEFFNSEFTEYENMSMNGYYRIWDCGNLTYILNQ